MSRLQARLAALKGEGYDYLLNALDVSIFPGELRRLFALEVAPRLVRALQDEGFELMVRRDPASFILVGPDEYEIGWGFEDTSAGALDRPLLAAAKQLIHLMALADWVRVWIGPRLAEFERQWQEKLARDQDGAPS